MAVAASQGATKVQLYASHIMKEIPHILVILLSRAHREPQREQQGAVSLTPKASSAVVAHPKFHQFEHYCMANLHSRG